MGQSSCKQVEKVKHGHSNKTMYENVKNNDHGAEKKFHSRFFYNKSVCPTTVDSLLVKSHCSKKSTNPNRDKVVNTRFFQRTPPLSSYGEKCESGKQSITPKQSVKFLIENVDIDKFNEMCDNPPGLISNVDENNSTFTQVISQGVEGSETNVEIEDSDSSVQTSIKTKGEVSDGCVPLYDVNFVGIEDKFASSLMYSPKSHAEYIDQPIYQKWLIQSD